MRIPKKLNFGGLVISVDDSFAEILNEKKEPIWGRSLGRGRIQLLSKKTLPVAHQAETFLHELLHQIDGNYHLNLSEKTTNLLSQGLFAFIVQNKLTFHE